MATTTTTTVTVRQTARTLKRTLLSCSVRLILRARDRLAARRRSCSRRRRSNEVSCSKAFSNWEMLCRIRIEKGGPGAAGTVAKHLAELTSRLRLTGAPEPAPEPSRMQLQVLEKRAIAGVWRDRQSPCETPAHEFGIDESVTDVHVGAQAPVAVAAPPPALDQPAVETRGAVPEALHRRSRLHRLGGVDADVADVLQLAADPGFDRVPVDRPNHLGVSARRISPGRADLLPRPQQHDRGDQHQRDAAEVPAAVEARPHPPSRAGPGRILPLRCSKRPRLPLRSAPHVGEQRLLDLADDLERLVPLALPD